MNNKKAIKEIDIVLKMIINDQEDLIIEERVENNFFFKNTIKKHYELYDKDTYTLKLVEKLKRLEKLKFIVKQINKEIENFKDDDCTECSGYDCMCMDTMKQNLLSYKTKIEETEFIIENLELILEKLNK